MNQVSLASFKEIWLVDFEFKQPDGERPEPICMVAREWRSGRLIRLWADELAKLKASPIPTGRESLFVAYYTSAEIGCYLSLGWALPARLLDLYVEFRLKRSGLVTPSGHGLLGALAYYGEGGIESIQKDSMRQLAMRGGPYNNKEKRELLEYCQSDVDALGKLLCAMQLKIDIPRAALRGRYVSAAAQIEFTGTPIDMNTWSILKEHWLEIRRGLIKQVDKKYGVFEEQTFKKDKFADYLARQRIPWPQLPSGALDLKDETFKAMSKSYPQLTSLRELRKTLSKLQLNKLAVGSDGRNRCMLSYFSTKTGRNAPSTNRFVFGLPAWLRGLIKPPSGHALAYIDWGQQEFGIAGALSKDTAMMEAYSSEDPYLTFAKQAGAVPQDATKQTHGEQRELFKVSALAVQYGMGEKSLAQQIKRPTIYARQLLRLHRQTYPKFWEWNDKAVEYAMLNSRIHTVFGWEVHVGSNSNPRSLMNFPMQANGAEMLRLACCYAIEGGIRICAPVHDAILIESPQDGIQQAITQSQEAMARASRVILNGFELRTDVNVTKFPDRYMDKRGAAMWKTVMKILEKSGS